MELRGFKENIECSEKHLEFVYENLHEILEKLDRTAPAHIEVVQKLRGNILSYYKELQTLKLYINAIFDQNIKHTDPSDLESLTKRVISSLIEIRKKLRTVRKILHAIKNELIDTEYTKLSSNVSSSRAIKSMLDSYTFPSDLASLLEEILDCRANIYAAERHISEFITALLNKTKHSKNGR